jgi:hypothetical protein
MITSELLEVLSKMNVPMVVFLGKEDDDEEETELLKEMKRHNQEMEDRPYIVPAPG